MKVDAKNNLAERLVAGLLTGFLVGFGWLNLLSGGISVGGKNGHAVFVSGDAGVLVALGTLFFAALAGLLLSAVFGLSRVMAGVVIAVIVLPPVAYIFLR